MNFCHNLHRFPLTLPKLEALLSLSMIQQKENSSSFSYLKVNLQEDSIQVLIRAKNLF